MGVKAGSHNRRARREPHFPETESDAQVKTHLLISQSRGSMEAWVVDSVSFPPFRWPSLHPLLLALYKQGARPTR